MEIASAHTFAILEAGKDDGERSRRWDAMIGTVRETCRIAGDNGLRVSYHFGWTSNLLVWNTETALRFLDGVGRSNAGVLYCPGSFYSAGDDVLDATRRLAGRSFLVHFRDSRKVSGECESLHLGQGNIPLREVLKILIESGYRGIVIPEHLGPATGQRREEISQAMAIGYLRGLLGSPPAE